MAAGDSNGNGNGVPELRAMRLRLYAQHQLIAVMRRDERVCRAEGLASRSQVEIGAGGRRIQALLYQLDGDLLQPGMIALSETAWQQLDLREGDTVRVRHPPVLESLAGVRGRLYGRRLEAAAMTAIVGDVAAGRYSDVHLAAFLTATAALPLDEEETYLLTRAMVDVGERLHWDAPIVLDKHCIGGLPGNRTSPLVVAIVAACGLIMPKTSSRAITSPAGTADTMETLAPVELDSATLRRVVAAEGGCLAWGGAMQLSPADEVFVRIERELDIDTEGQLIASVLSKKIAAGSTHVVIDIPVGDTAKVRTREAGDALAQRLHAIGARFGLAVYSIVSDGSQPVGRGLGPALEARDVLAVLRNLPAAPADLRERAVTLAGAALEIGGKAAPGQGARLAGEVLADGRAWAKFQRICAAQGGLREPPVAAYRRPLKASRDGRVGAIDNRRLSRLAKLSGAPEVAAAGVLLQVRLGDVVTAGQPLLTVHAESPGELDYAFDYLRRSPDLIRID